VTAGQKRMNSTRKFQLQQQAFAEEMPRTNEKKKTCGKTGGGEGLKKFFGGKNFCPRQGVEERLKAVNGRVVKYLQCGKLGGGGSYQMAAKHLE